MSPETEEDNVHTNENILDFKVGAQMNTNSDTGKIENLDRNGDEVVEDSDKRQPDKAEAEQADDEQADHEQADAEQADTEQADDEA